MTSQNEEKSKEEEKKTNNKPKWQKSYFDVLGLCCTSEVPIIDNILKSLDGVKEYSVIVPSRTVIVVHDTLLISPLQIAKALNQARLEANVKVTGDTKFKNKWPSPFAVVSGLLLLLSFLKYVYPPLHWLAVAAVACGIYPILAKAVASIRRLRVDINILVIITVIATLAMQDFMEAAAVVFLFTIAEWLETRASYKATSVMQSLMSLAPQKAVIAETGEEVEVNDVNIDTILAVKAGETIPIDGIVVDGNCEVDEKTLTGEAFPVPKQIDSTVFAGTINLNGYICVKTTALASDCVVAKMAKLVEEAQSSKTKSQRLIDKCSLYYTPIIVIISASIAAIPAIMKLHNLNHWFHLALVVLVSACPCGLILSTPVATFCALTKAATSGLLIKSADYLDTLSKIKTVAFDKTGTITRGEFIVVDFKLLSSDISLHTLVYWVSSVESKSSHPMAATLVDYARTVSIEPTPEEVLDYKNFPGEGIYGNIDGNDIYIGNKRIASRAMCSTETEVDTKGGKTIGYVYVGERLAGVFNLSDACRSGVAQAIKELKDLGIKTAMLTGDNQESANHAQEELENALDAVHGDLLPEDKSKIIQDFKKQGKTAMVGDGINDAPALATADIGISMGVSGSALATQTGHIILMSNDIRRIPKAIKLARRAQRKVVQNVFISITLKAGILALAIAGHPLIWAAVLVDVATCLIVILNSMLLLREKDRSKDKKCYRASTNGQKLDGCDEQGIDLEAGLLKNGQCNSGCCGDKKKQQKAIAMAKPSSHDHSHSGGCCGDKNTQQKVMARQGTKPSSDHSHSGGCCGDKNTPQKVMTIQGTKPSSDHSHSGGCCGDKNTQQKVMARQGTKPSSDHSHSGGCCGDKNTPQKVMTIQGTKPSSDHSHSGGCCGDKNTQQKVMAKPSSDHSHSGGCFGDKKQENVKLVKDGCCGEKTKKPEREMASLSSCKKSSHTHNDMKMKSGSSCCANKSEKGKETVAKSCCEEKKPHAEKNIAMQILGHDKTGLDIEAGVSCGDTKGEVREHFELKSEGRCKTSCCGDEKETGEITLASEEKTDSVDCSLGCCKEEVNQSCHEKTCPVTETDASCGLKLACCDHTEGEVREEGEIVKASSQGCCTRSPSDHLVLPALQVKKVESCCNVKKSQEEACGSKCSEREKLHIGKSCCRSYAKEYCSHRHHHGHHHGHHHHHHHVGAA